MKVTFNTTGLDFDGDMEKSPQSTDRIGEFYIDGMSMTIEEFKTKWRITELRRLGKYHCRAGYTDRLYPEKSWSGSDPETMARIKTFMDSLDKESK